MSPLKLMRTVKGLGWQSALSNTDFFKGAIGLMLSTVLCMVVLGLAALVVVFVASLGLKALGAPEGAHKAVLLVSMLPYLALVVWYFYQYVKLMVLRAHAFGISTAAMLTFMGTIFVISIVADGVLHGANAGWNFLLAVSIVANTTVMLYLYCQKTMVPNERYPLVSVFKPGLGRWGTVGLWVFIVFMLAVNSVLLLDAVTRTGTVPDAVQPDAVQTIQQ